MTTPTYTIPDLALIDRWLTDRLRRKDALIAALEWNEADIQAALNYEKVVLFSERVTVRAELKALQEYATEQQFQEANHVSPSD